LRAAPGSTGILDYGTPRRFALQCGQSFISGTLVRASTHFIFREDQGMVLDVFHFGLDAVAAPIQKASAQQGQFLHRDAIPA
jgi:hypothetical protein